MAAGLLLASRRFADQYELPRLSAAEVLEATGVGKTRAYEVADAIFNLLPGLVAAPGRPAAKPAEPTSPSDTEAILREVLEYCFAHPGCVTGTTRRTYSDGFRQFVVELRERFPAVDTSAFADAVGVPPGTLADWLRAPTGTETNAPNSEPADDAASHPRIQAVLGAWERWHGPFTKFCDHVRNELRIPYGRTFVATILKLHGVRLPRRRPGRSPDELALRGAFETFFPGAQWVGDGMQVPVVVNDNRYTFNLELNVDASSAALVGAHVGDEEDADAVVNAFHDGVRATGASPLALLLDNRESNHTPAVEQALGDTMKIRATPGRGQNKAHTEGAFGLFSQTAPPLQVATSDLRDLARQILALVVTVWGRTLNHKPRHDREGRSRAELYRENPPTAEQVDAATHALDARRKKQEKAYQTRQAREDPIVRALLDREFDRLGLLDPDGNLKSAMARYPLDAILPALAVFEGKRQANTLPDSADGRYLFGIVKNLSHRVEDHAMTETLIRLRLDARDVALAPLAADHRSILRDHDDPQQSAKQLLDRALGAERHVDYLFWLSSLVDLLTTQPMSDQLSLFRFIAARIRASYRVPHQRRQDSIHFLAQRCPPLRVA